MGRICQCFVRNSEAGFQRSDGDDVMMKHCNLHCRVLSYNGTDFLKCVNQLTLADVSSMVAFLLEDCRIESNDNAAEFLSKVMNFVESLRIDSRIRFAPN